MGALCSCCDTSDRHDGRSVSDPSAQHGRGFRGGGQRLGGGGSGGGGAGAAAGAAAEARRGGDPRGGDPRGGAAGSKTHPSSTPKVQEAPRRGTADSRTSSGVAAADSGDDRRGAAAAAAERRAQEWQQRGVNDSGKAAELNERRIKDDLIGKIEHYCRLAGKEPPFGLPVCSVDALRKHLEYAKGNASSLSRT